MNLTEITGFASEISLKAGNILLQGFRSKDTIVSYKSRTNLVTNIDRESEDYLVSSIREKFPDHSIIAEEGSRHDKEGDIIWYIDPLDATNNYAHGIPFFCISLGIYSKRNGRMEAGIVYDPFHKELFKAARGQGALLNNNIIHVSSMDDLGRSILGTGFPYNKSDQEKNNLKQFNVFLPRLQGIRRIGSAALDLCYVACGRIDGFWEGQLYPWDMAAGSITGEEAGGKLTQSNGDPFDPEYPEILSSNGKIHQVMVDIFKSL